MATSTRTVTIDNLYSAQLTNRTAELFDNIFGDHAFFWALRDGGGFESEVGGSSIERQVEYGENTSVQSIGLGGEVSLNVPEFMKTCNWEWRFIAGSIVRYFVLERKNRGTGRVMRLINKAIDNLKKSMTKKLEADLFGDGTGGGGDDIDGLGNIVAITPTTGTVGGINRANDPWWQNYYAVSAGDAQVNLRPEVTTMYNTISLQNDRPNLSVTDQTIYELYEAEHVAMRQISEKTRLADAGFTTFSFKGHPVIYSDSAPSGVWRMLNLRYLKLVYDAGIKFEMTDWKSKAETLDHYAQVVFGGNLICTNPRMQGVLSSIAE